MKYLNHNFVILLSIFIIYFPTYGMEQTIVTKRQSIIASANDQIVASRQSLYPLRQKCHVQKDLLNKKRNSGENITLQEMVNYNTSLQKYNTLIPEIDKIFKNQTIKDIEETTQIIDQSKLKTQLINSLKHCKNTNALSDLIECQKLLTSYISLSKNSNNQQKNESYEKYLKNITEQINQMKIAEKTTKLLPLTEDNQKTEVIVSPLPNEEKQNNEATEIILFEEEEIINLRITEEFFQEPFDDKKEEIIPLSKSQKEETQKIAKEMPKFFFMNGKLSFITKTMAIIATCALIFYKYDTLFPILEKIQCYYPNLFR